MASTKDTRPHSELVAANKARKQSAQEDKSRAVEAARAAMGAAINTCDAECKAADAELGAEEDRRSKAIVADLYAEALPLFDALREEPSRKAAVAAHSAVMKFDQRCREELGEPLHRWHAAFLCAAGNADCFVAPGVVEACEAFMKASSPSAIETAFRLLESGVTRVGRPDAGKFYREHATYGMAACAQEAARLIHQARITKGHHLAGPVPVPKAPVQVALGGLESLPSN